MALYYDIMAHYYDIMAIFLIFPHSIVAIKIFWTVVLPQ